MKDILSATKITCVGNKLYFLTDEEGAYGRIQIESGEVDFYESTPNLILGHTTYNNILVSANDDIYIVANEGKNIVGFNPVTAQFSQIECENERVMYGGWAGCLVFDNKIYAFSRENGKLLIIDALKKKSEQSYTGINEKIVWVCGNGEKVYMLSWDCKSIYFLNLKTMEIRNYRIDLSQYGKIKSYSSIPVHSINCDDIYIYIMDANKILRFDIQEHILDQLSADQDGNNGSRILTARESVIIPPFKNNEFKIINRETGECIMKIAFPSDIKFGNFWRGSRTGFPFVTDSCTFIPVMDSNVILSIDKETLEFKWIYLHFDEDSMRDTVSRIIDTKKIIEENSFITVDNFLKSLI